MRIQKDDNVLHGLKFLEKNDTPILKCGKLEDSWLEGFS
jgi:hypothetical protein